MEPQQPINPSPKRPGAVPRWLALVLLGAVVAVGFMAVAYASDAQETRAGAELLKDGVDRSNLPFEQAVALANVARIQSAPLPESEGHDHHHDMPHEALTPEEQEQFDAQWQTAVDAAKERATLDQVKELGYVRSAGETDGAGEHWTDWRLVTESFDPARPSQVLLDELVWGEGLELIAFSYWVTSDGPPEGFVGDLDVWHRHRGVCFMNGMIFDENMQPHECEGDWFNGEDLWMLHAWVVPGVENVYGLFHSVNPLLCEHACGLED